MTELGQWEGTAGAGRGWLYRGAGRGSAARQAAAAAGTAVLGLSRGSAAGTMPVHSREKKENNHDEMEVDYGENEGSTSEEEETESSSVSEEGDSSGTGVTVSAAPSARPGGNRPPAPAATLPVPAPAATPPRGPPVAAAQPGAGTWRGHGGTSSAPPQVLVPSGPGRAAWCRGVCAGPRWGFGPPPEPMSACFFAGETERFGWVFWGLSGWEGTCQCHWPLLRSIKPCSAKGPFFLCLTCSGLRAGDDLACER